MKTPTIKIKDEHNIVQSVNGSTHLLHTINRDTLHISEAYTHTLVEVETELLRLKHYNFQNDINYEDDTTTLSFWNKSEDVLMLKIEIGVAGMVNVDCNYGWLSIEIGFLPTHTLPAIKYETLE